MNLIVKYHNKASIIFWRLPEYSSTVFLILVIVYMGFGCKEAEANKNQAGAKSGKSMDEFVAEDGRHWKLTDKASGRLRRIVSGPSKVTDYPPATLVPVPYGTFVINGISYAWQGTELTLYEGVTRIRAWSDPSLDRIEALRIEMGLELNSLGWNDIIRELEASPE